MVVLKGSGLINAMVYNIKHMFFAFCSRVWLEYLILRRDGMREFQVDGRTISGYLAVPEQGSGPGYWFYMHGGG